MPAAKSARIPDCSRRSSQAGEASGSQKVVASRIMESLREGGSWEEESRFGEAGHTRQEGAERRTARAVEVGKRVARTRAISVARHKGGKKERAGKSVEGSKHGGMEVDRCKGGKQEEVPCAALSCKIGFQRPSGRRHRSQYCKRVRDPGFGSAANKGAEKGTTLEIEFKS